MRSFRVAVVIGATLLALVLTLAGCSGGDEPEAQAPTPEPTPLADLATDTITVVRGTFCDRIASDAVEDALGGPAAREGDSWANGDRARVARGVTDVVHEHGCRWRAEDGTTASGWVFAPPVTPDRAAALRREAVRAEGCRRVVDAPAYGSHSVAVRCGDTTSFHGLFGDAWLSCSLRVAGQAEEDVLERADRWCVTVIQAASA